MLIISRFDNTLLNRLGVNTFWKYTLPVLKTKSNINLFNSNQLKLINDLITFFYTYGFSVNFIFKTVFYTSKEYKALADYTYLNFNFYYYKLSIRKEDFSDSYLIYIRRRVHLKYPITIRYFYYHKTFMVVWYFYNPQPKYKIRNSSISKKIQLNTLTKLNLIRRKALYHVRKFINYVHF